MKYLFTLCLIMFTQSIYAQRVSKYTILDEYVNVDLMELIVKDLIDEIKEESDDKVTFEYEKDFSGNSYTFKLFCDEFRIFINLAKDTEQENKASVLTLYYVLDKGEFVPLTKLNEYNRSHRWGYAVKLEDDKKIYLENDLFYDGLTIKALKNFIYRFIKTSAKFDKELMGG